MKHLSWIILTFSLSAFAQQYGGASAGDSSPGTGHAPGHGAAAGQGTYTTPNAGLGEAAPTTTTRGTDINGAGTMGTSAYPNSGETRNRSTDITGDDATSGTFSSSNQNPTVPDRNPTSQKRDGSIQQVPKAGTQNEFDEALSKGKTQTGPYDVTGEKQAEEAKEPRPIENNGSKAKLRKQQGD